MPARNPADKVHYIVRFRDWRLTYSVTFALDVPQMGTIGWGEFNNRRLLAFQPSFSFQGLSEKESNTSFLGREYLNGLFALQEFLFRQFIPSIHSVLI